MSYRENGDTVTLEMSRDDYAKLMLLLGIATGSCSNSPDHDLFWDAVDFLNRLNAGNPEFRQYQIPEIRAAHADRP